MRRLRPAAAPDVFVCCARPEASGRARTVAAALQRRGFRVSLHYGRADETQRLLPLVEQAPDFVLVTVAGAGTWPDTVRTTVTRALETQRNIVCVMPSGGEGLPADLPPSLAPLSRADRVRLDEAHPAESTALLAHRLSSEGTVDERRLMRRARRIFLAAALVLLAGVALQEIPRLLERWSRPTLQSPVAPFAVYWTGIGQRVEAGRTVAYPLADGASVTGGDRLRLAFATSADGYAYVLARNAHGDVSLLFPSEAVRGASRVKAEERHVAPIGEEWLRVDEDAPVEVIYLVAGYDAQQNLEELIEETGPSTATPAARRALLEAAIGGLLDGRHGAAERRVWTGRLHPIDQDLPVPAPPGAVRLTLADGTALERGFSTQRGLVSASVELRLRPRAPR